MREYIRLLNPSGQAKMHQHIERLNALGEALDYPHTSQVDGELRELRAWFGNRHFRVFYRRSQQFAVLLHIIDKRSGKLPKNDIAIARARWLDFRTRMDQHPRIPPRALGSDAP